ncbi:hypothetical protein AAG906_020693 [Vitis piasezkii]
MDFYQSMTTQDVQGSIAIRFSIDGRQGILEARHIAEALHIPFQPRGSRAVQTVDLHISKEHGPTFSLSRFGVKAMTYFGCLIHDIYGFYFGPHHLIMDALLYFEEKVHRKKLQRADAIPLLFLRLRCHLVERNSAKAAPPVPVPPSIPSTPAAPSMPQATSTDPLATPHVPPQDRHSIILDQHTTILHRYNRIRPRVPVRRRFHCRDHHNDVLPRATHETTLEPSCPPKVPRYLIIGHLFILLY